MMQGQKRDTAARTVKAALVERTIARMVSKANQCPICEGKGTQYEQRAPAPPCVGCRGTGQAF